MDVGLGGNSEVCCAGVLKLIDKKQGPVPTVTFLTLLLPLYIYTCLDELFPRLLVHCVFVSLSLWTCFECCYFELDLGFTQLKGYKLYSSFEERNCVRKGNMAF